MPEKLWLKFKHRGQRREGDERGRPSLLQCPCWALANTVTLKREYQVNEPNIKETIFPEGKLKHLLS